ncbi:MAG: adenylate/guanylate cyclase domain-containing protein [Planctomycetota bacterium]
MRNQTLTVLISDLQGYTERQARSSRAAIASDLGRFGALLKPIFAVFEGELVKSMGDAFLVCFESPTNAVLAAIQVQRQLDLQNQTLAPGQAPMRVRIGIATGEVSRDESGDVFGDPVNLAARLQSNAESSTIWLAETTYLSMNKNEVQALEVGARVFKGVPGEVKVYRVLDECIAATRLLSEEELAQQLVPLRRDQKGTRRVAYVALGVALAAALVAFVALQQRDERSAEVRYRADPTDLSSGDDWLNEVAARLFAAHEGEIQTLYREGDIARLLEEQNKALGTRASYVRLRLVWGMLAEPLLGGLAEAVLDALQRDPALRKDARFMQLLRDTVDYALRDEERFAAYQRALTFAETP